VGGVFKIFEGGVSRATVRSLRKEEKTYGFWDDVKGGGWHGYDVGVVFFGGRDIGFLWGISGLWLVEWGGDFLEGYVKGNWVGKKGKLVGGRWP